MRERTQVDERLRNMLADHEFLTTMLDALGDSTRLTIVEAVVERGEIACSELDSMLGPSKSTISYHTKLLSSAGLIHTERDGRFFRYTPTKLAENVISTLKGLAATERLPAHLLQVSGTERGGH